MREFYYLSVYVCMYYYYYYYVVTNGLLSLRYVC